MTSRSLQGKIKGAEFFIGNFSANDLDLSLQDIRGHWFEPRLRLSVVSSSK